MRLYNPSNGLSSGGIVYRNSYEAGWRVKAGTEPAIDQIKKIATLCALKIIQKNTINTGVQINGNDKEQSSILENRSQRLRL